MKGKGYITFMVAAALSMGFCGHCHGGGTRQWGTGRCAAGNHDRDGGQVGAPEGGCSCYLPYKKA